MKLIGLTGQARAGKDSFAAALVDAGWQTVSFAAPIKRALTALGWERSQLYGDEKELVSPLWGVSGRRAMQTLGTEWGRNTIHPELWLRLAAHDIASHIRDGSNVVVTDVRFNDEALLIHLFGGTCVKVERDTSLYNVQYHLSEAGISPSLVHTTVQNDSTLEALALKAHSLVGELAELQEASIESGEFFLKNAIPVSHVFEICKDGFNF